MRADVRHIYPGNDEIELWKGHPLEPIPIGREMAEVAFGLAAGARIAGSGGRVMDAPEGFLAHLVQSLYLTYGELHAD